MNSTKFNPLEFLAAVGAGGISVIPFAFLQYTFHSQKGLINVAHLLTGELSFFQGLLFGGLALIMLVFGALHFLLSANLIVKYSAWRKTEEYRNFVMDPLKNQNILALFVSLGMTMNVTIAVVRFFIPPFAQNLQMFMAPALVVWLILWAALLKTEIKLLKVSFNHSFDVNKISFGWLMHPFALAMITVVGTGIAAMAQSFTVSSIAAFASSVSGSMGVFLLGIKLVTIFKSHFATKGLGEKHFLPSFLSVIPIVTLFSISGFRMVHYFETQFNYPIHWIGTFIILGGFVFETWYFAFGLSMMKEYFKRDFFKREYYATLWSLICPFVAYAVLGSFLYKVFVPNPVLYSLILVTMVVAIAFYAYLAVRKLKCSKVLPSNKKYTCAA